MAIRRTRSEADRVLAVVTDDAAIRLATGPAGTLPAAPRNLHPARPSNGRIVSREDRAALILDSIGDAVIATDMFGRITYLNAAAETITDWSPSAALGRPAGEVFRIIDGSTRVPIDDHLQLAALRGRPSAWTGNGILVSRDGRETPIEDSVTPIRDALDRIVGAVAIFRDVSEARAAAMKISHLAQHDFLTDLPNRLLFNDRLVQGISMAQRHQRLLAVLSIDCDNFKDVNDSLGHATGDLLLQSIAKRLASVGRCSDTVSRHGGDEFVILLSELENREDAALCARKILAALSTPHRIGRHDRHVTASIGVAVYPADGRNAETLLHAADLALYQAKECGGNAFRNFDPDMRTRAIARQSLESGLMRALENDEFRLHYQPRFNLATGAVVGVEALLRWHHPKRGVVLPDEFVPVAEESGLILPIGRWVLAEACKQAALWRSAGLGLGPVAVNVSPIEIRSADYLDGVASALAGKPVDATLLELEIAESLLVHDPDSVCESLRSLTELGVRLALDNFGTGVSRLSSLKRFPISTLKLHRSFVHELSRGDSDRTLVKAIIDLGRSLGQTVIAKGIENGDQLEALRELNCDQGQGFHFCRPLPADELASFLSRMPARPEGRLYA